MGMAGNGSTLASRRTKRAAKFDDVFKVGVVEVRWVIRRTAHLFCGPAGAQQHKVDSDEQHPRDSISLSASKNCPLQT